MAERTAYRVGINLLGIYMLVTALNEFPPIIGYVAVWSRPGTGWFLAASLTAGLVRLLFGLILLGNSARWAGRLAAPETGIGEAGMLAPGTLLGIGTQLLGLLSLVTAIEPLSSLLWLVGRRYPTDATLWLRTVPGSVHIIVGIVLLMVGRYIANASSRRAAPAHET